MTPEQVKNKAAKISKKQEMWALAEKELQAACQHPNASKKYAGSTGNYDPAADDYWIEFRCLDCGKFWITDQ